MFSHRNVHNDSLANLMITELNRITKRYLFVVLEFQVQSIALANGVILMIDSSFLVIKITTK